MARDISPRPAVRPDCPLASRAISFIRMCGPFCTRTSGAPPSNVQTVVVHGESDQLPAPRQGGALDSSWHRAGSLRHGHVDTLQSTCITDSVAATAKVLWRHRRVKALWPVRAFVGKRLKDEGRQGGLCEGIDGGGASKVNAPTPDTVGGGLENGWLERATWVRCVQPRGQNGQNGALGSR